jgi:hypothetical protein
MGALPDGANVLVYGSGPIQALAARLAAIRGFKTSKISQDVDQDMAWCYDDVYPEDKIPLTILPISGGEGTVAAVQKAVDEAEGCIIAFDKDIEYMSEAKLNIVVPSTSKMKHVALMSRYLNGGGMGFFPNAAKAAANNDIWTAPSEGVEAYKQMEDMLRKRAEEIGATFSIVRAGTLKGGGCRSEPTYLNEEVYNYGVQDIVNWRMLFDRSVAGAEISKGDTLPGPGFTAVFTARDEVGPGDSGRGAVASALVESLRTPAADNVDFSVKSVQSKKAPSSEDMKAMIEKAMSR